MRHHDFYVAFVVEEEYRVNHAGHHVGNVAFVPEFEEERFLILAGRRWQILDIDHDRKTITVEPSPGGRVPTFHSDGREDIHPRVRQVMKGLLERTDTIEYLDMKAREMLLQARCHREACGTAAHAILSGRRGHDLVYLDRVANPADAAGPRGNFGGLKVRTKGSRLVFEKASAAQVQAVYCKFLKDCPDAVSLALRFPQRVREKYEGFLSDELTAEVFARERTDLKGAIEKIRELAESVSSANGPGGA